MEDQITQLRKFITDKFEEKLVLHLNDQFLQNFINGRKGDLESSKKYLEAYMQMRFKTYPELILDALPIQTRLYLEGHFRLLKGTDPNGCLVLCASAKMWNPDSDPKRASEEWLHEFCFFWDYFMLHDDTLCKRGLVAIMDTRGWEYKHVRLFTIPNIIRLVNVGLKYPVRFKGIHIIMESLVIKGILNLMYPFFPRKLSSRIHIHRNVESLGDHIPKEILPSDLSGLLQDDDAYDLNLPNKLKGIEQHFAEISVTLKEDL